MTVYQFSIVRYVPDPFRQEQLNVGVILSASEPSILQARFMKKSQVGRLRRLGLETDYSFIQDVAAEIEQSLSAQLAFDRSSEPGPWSASFLERASEEWGGTIQLSELRVKESDDEPSRILTDLFKRLVAVETGARREFKDKRIIKYRTARVLRAEAKRRLPNQDPIHVVRAQATVTGKVEDHDFDYGIWNGKPLHLVEAFSFDVEDREDLKTNLDATAWAIEDLKRGKNPIPVTLISMGSRQAKLLRTAKGIAKELKVDLVAENELAPWATDLFDDLVPSLLNHG